LHEQDAANHNAGSEILHAVIHAIAERPSEEFGQQLLLLAFTPAIHKICSEISQRFPSLPPEDIAQQAWLCLLEAARSTVIARQNGHLLLALVREFRKNTFRWAIKEARITTTEDVNTDGEAPEQVSEDNLQRGYEICEFLRHCRSRGALSEADYELLLKFQCEGFEAAELRGTRWGSAKAVHHRLEKILNRLRRLAEDPDSLKPEPAAIRRPQSRPNEKKLRWGAEFWRGNAHLVIVRRNSHRSFPARCLKSKPTCRTPLYDVQSAETRHRSHPLT
jgi:hypothetical protein